MMPSVEEIVLQTKRAIEASKRKINTPAKARAFLIRAGIAEKCKSSPSGVRLAKRFR